MPNQPTTNISGPYYAVQNIASAICIYSGKSLTSAVMRLAPGTCYGRGWTTEQAVTQCNEWRDWFAARSKGESDE